MSAQTMADMEGCSAKPKQPDELYGKQWLAAYKSDPALGVTLRRCHYEQSAQDRVDLVPPSSVITDDAEVQRIVLALPDSTDPGYRCGPGGDYQFVYTFDEYTVVDQSGTPRATFQTSDNNPCGINDVVPST
ncbi:hypothetical protein GS979_07170 [Rhodococcus hoagii]|nr:hypothetical protein [Prescottella equi]NKW46192.1 hypothetical protein [Prescottella equi]